MTDSQLKKPTDHSRRILDYLRDPEHADATSVDLANHFQVTRRAISSRLSYLEAHGYISRQRTGRTEPCRVNLTRKAFTLFHAS